MEDQMFTGVGCFAKLDRLERIFYRLLRNYSLGPFKGTQQLNSHLPKNNNGTHLLQSLMAGLTKTCRTSSNKIVNLKNSREIAGFYLTMKDQKLNLSIFARGNNSRSEIFRTNLEELTRLRQKRLN